MSSSDGEEEIICTPPDVTETANRAITELLPNKSKKVYELFNNWCETKFIKNITENVLLVYLQEKLEKLQPSTLWMDSEYSMLKATLLINKNLDIRRFTKLIPFLKKKNVGFLPKSFFDRFLTEAPDNQYLVMKIVAVFGMDFVIIEESISKRIEIASQILEGETSTSTTKLTTRKRVISEEDQTVYENKIQKITGNEDLPSITVANCSNCDVKIEITSKK